MTTELDLDAIKAQALWIATNAAETATEEEWNEHWDRFYSAVTPTAVLDWIDARDALVAEVERLRSVLGSCAGFIVSVRDDHTTDEWTEDAARRLCQEIYAALHPQEPSDDH